MKRKKPAFVRQRGRLWKRLGEKWRVPKGRHSKLRQDILSRGVQPMPGYGSPLKTRGLHPSGFQEVLIYNVPDLSKLTQSQAARISSTVGNKKRIEIQKKAEEMKIKILNPKKIEERKKEAPEVEGR